MSYYDKYKPGVVWDFECPSCGEQWDNESDPIKPGIEADEECPKCKARLKVTAEYSVDYELRVVKKSPYA